MNKETKHETIKDPLLKCLVILSELHNTPYSAEALTAGLPIEKGFASVELFSLESGSKSLFSRVAKRAGFASKLVKREIRKISPLVLPCILILKGQSACILESFDAKNNRARIIHPDIQEGESWVDIDKLEEEYLGFCFLLKKEFTPQGTRENLLNNGNDHWFWGTLKRSSKIYFHVIVASLIVNIFVLASPLFTMNVYDRVIPNSATDTLWVLALGVTVVLTIDVLLKFTRSYFLEVAGKKSDVIMSSMIFEKVMGLTMSARPRSVGSFASNLRDFESVRNFLTSSTIAAIIDLPFAIIFLLTIHFIAGSLVLVPIVLMVIILIYTFIIKNPLQRSIESTYVAAGVKNGILIESLNALETLKTLSAGGQAQWKWEEAEGEVANKGFKSKVLSSSISTVTSFLIQLNTVIVIIFGVYMIKDMQLTMGGLIASIILSTRAISPMAQVASLISSFEQTKTAYKAINDIMQLPVERPEGKKFIRREKFMGKIEFKNVSFAYPGNEHNALENVSFKIEAGEKVGILGRNGSGKTTIEKLILGLYIPTSGSVLIDGIDINQIDPVDLRKNIAYIPQDVVLLNGTVRENIVYKAPYVDDETILRAIKVGGVDDFVDSNPLGADLPVMERGDGISGGQRQSVAIARAFLLDSPIVLLDEPTNSLDNSTENKIRDLLKENIQDKTAILVTHKVSLLNLVDRLIVLNDAHVVIDGKKDEVLAKLNGVK